MKSYELPKQSFITGNYIPAEICDDLVSYFDNTPERQVLSQIALYSHNPNDMKILDKYLDGLIHCVAVYEKTFERARSLNDYAITERICIQKYNPNEGYDTWHCERNGIENNNRCFAFMSYLNDVSDGGTEFLYQDLNIPAEKGLTLIWPSDWTHTHRDVLVENDCKYLITGYFNYTGINTDTSISNERGISSCPD